MLKWIKNFKSKKSSVYVKKETRLEQMKKNPYKRVDSENMTDIEKMLTSGADKVFINSELFLMYSGTECFKILRSEDR